MKSLLISITLISYAFSYISADVAGQNGVVVSSKIEASKIGVDILKKGGNAIDAAVGVCFALSVTHPSAGNIGGGGFMVIKFADGSSTSIDFRETAPLNSYREMFLDDSSNVIEGLSTDSILSSGVPGTVAGLGYAHQKYGTLDWENLIIPSVFLAKFGFELDSHNLSILNDLEIKEKLSKDINTKDIFTKSDPFVLNELFIQNDLSTTLHRISKYGYKEFYYGETADMIISTMKKIGGIITYDDLEQYQPNESPPIKFSYRNNQILSMPPSSSGGITLALILNQIENLDLSTFSFHDTKHVHYLVEAEKNAYFDRYRYLGDSSFIDIPFDKLLSKQYAQNKFLSINDSLSIIIDGMLNEEIFINNESEETTHFSIIDKYGNCVSVTTTLNGQFGNGIIVDDAGFLLNNQMDDFSIKPGYPNMYGLIGSETNSIKPLKRMLSSMTPTIVSSSDEKPLLILGSPGGSTIITTIAQIIINVIDFKMEIKDAVEAKRFHHQWIPDLIQIEKHSLSNEVINKLSTMGHDIIYRSPIGIGEANCIMIEDGIYYGSSDSRRGSKALAY